jgi:hypothetical protein
MIVVVVVVVVMVVVVVVVLLAFGKKLSVFVVVVVVVVDVVVVVRGIHRAGTSNFVVGGSAKDISSVVSRAGVDGEIRPASTSSNTTSSWSLL